MAETTPLAFFESVYDAYHRAEQAVGGATDRYYTIGGYTVRLRFAGPALVPFITLALDHLAASPIITRADLTICLWDSVSTATSMPPRPWKWDDYMARGEVRGFSNARIHTAMSGDVGAVSMFDETENLGVYWVRDARELPSYETAAPLRVILNWWLINHGLQLTHVAAVGSSEVGVLLAGKGGSGKSTTALNCLRSSKLVYVGDDYCLLATNPHPYVYSLYNSAKVEPSNLHRIPHFKSAISNLDRLDKEKAILFLHQHYPERIVKGFPICAVLLPRITHRQESTLLPASPTAGLKALAPSTIFQFAGTEHVTFQTMVQLVRQVPCYYLELGTEIPRIPDVIADLLTAVQGGGSWIQPHSLSA